MVGEIFENKISGMSVIRKFLKIKMHLWSCVIEEMPQMHFLLKQ